jgi:predicted nuclease of restriction endonuclease-like RecB superfamily
VLTSELLRVRRKQGAVVPCYLLGKQRARLEPLAAALVAAIAANRGRRRTTIEAALDEVDHRPADRLVVLGLRKLLLDRCELAFEEGADPATVREQVFWLAAAKRRGLGARETLDREAIIVAAAEALELDPSEVEGRLFADLKGNERLIKFRALSPAALLERYDVALAQGVLLRATKVTVTLTGESPGRARQLFRAARFHGLLHRVTRHQEGHYRVELDGPFSLFSAVQKYGFKLALFLPALLRCRRWHLKADLLWGKQREPLTFELGPDQGLVPHDRRITGVAPELARFVTGFTKLGSSWSVARNDRVFALPGEAVCVPDLVFTNDDTGEEVFLEAFGFWSRQAVWQRLETMERGFPSPIILAVGKQLRVSEEVLEDGTVANLYVYRTTIRPKAILERLEQR